MITANRPRPGVDFAAQNRRPVGAIKFDMPSKFVPKGDERLKHEQMNKHQIAYKEADDSVKELAQTPDIIDAWTWAVLDQYKDCAVQIPGSMKEANDEFRSNDGESESTIFHVSVSE